VRESLQILAAIHSLGAAAERARTDELVERPELAEFFGTSVRQLSLGQRMRAEVVGLAVEEPDLEEIVRRVYVSRR
jgi:ABC-2 type transport system ATP-binding protein